MADFEGKHLQMSLNRLEESTSPDIIYVGVFQFPDRNGGAARVLGNGKALREAGFQVMFAGVEKRGRPEDLQPDGKFYYQGFPYLPEKDLGDTRLSRLKRAWLTHLSGSTTMKRLRSIDLTRTRAIIAYNTPSALLWRLQSFCRRQRIGLIADCTEWYDPAHVIGGRLGPFRWSVEWRMRRLQVKIGRVMTNSTFLEEFYRNRGCSVLLLPHLMDLDDQHWKVERETGPDENALRLVYAGIPGRKDLLGNIIRGLRILRQNGLSVVLEVLGPSREAVAECLGSDTQLLDELQHCIVCHGRVPQRTLPGLIVNADFSVLLRPDKRYAHAGFPTKVIDSLTCGVPVIANVTSDIADYVRDGVEGILLDDCTPNAMVDGVRKALEMPREQWRFMRDNCRRRARECFDYRRFVQPLREFVEGAVTTRADEHSRDEQ